jgi:hypothetical protein
MVKERRRHERVHLLAEVQIPHDDEVEVLFARDLSEGGVFLSAGPDESPWLLPGVPVDLTIALANEPGGPDGLAIKARGRVMWRLDRSSGNSPGIGVAFERLDDDNRAVLVRVIGHVRDRARDD